VIWTISGYTGGSVANPTYEQVSAGGTGHRESVEVPFDPKKVSYETLLDVYWRNIDPFDDKGQFCDKGNQYRSAIFVTGDEQKVLAEDSNASWRSASAVRSRPTFSLRVRSIAQRNTTRTITRRTRCATGFTGSAAGAMRG
jgi:peptide-methionine (S)-S-oxide reductase